MTTQAQDNDTRRERIAAEFLTDHHLPDTPETRRIAYRMADAVLFRVHPSPQYMAQLSRDLDRIQDPTK